MNERDISRRTFIIGSAGAIMAACSYPLSTFPPTEIHTKELLSPKDAILNEILTRYGIRVPQRVNTSFEIESPVLIPRREPPYPEPFDEPVLPADLTYEEANVIKDSLDHIPGVGSLVQLILIYRLDRFANDIISSATKRHGLFGSAPRNGWFRELKHPEFNPLGGSWAFWLYLSPEFDLDAPQTIKTMFKTQGEYLTFFFGHESGHNLSYKVLRVSYGGENVDRLRVVHFTSRDSISEFVSSGEHDPIYSTYGQIFGWRFGNKETVNLEGSEIDTSDYEPFWFREKPENWSLERWSNPQAESDIEEAFADDFAFSIFYPDKLTPKELKYFRNIHDGLNHNQEMFFQEVTKNPNILLV